jgi:hypothetical protein
VDAKHLLSSAAAQFLRHTDGVIYSTNMESGVFIDTVSKKKTIGYCLASEGVGTPECANVVTGCGKSNAFQFG